MTSTTTTRSAYPRQVPDLIPHARDLAADLGEVPSRNRLMKTFKVGDKKAKALLDALTADLAAEPVPAPLDPPAEADDETDDQAAPVDPPPSAAPGAEVAGVAPPNTEPESVTEVASAEAAVPDRRPVTWPVLILCLPAFVAIWGGWVEMGRLTGFGVVKLLPGIADSVELDTAITLPIGVETYAAYALYVWLSGRATGDARRFAKWSALASLALGAAGQIAYHLMAAAGWTSAPWLITAAVACIPVAVLGMGAALAHLMHQNH